MSMRVAVLGAGAVGCYFGGMIARAGVPVTLIGRRAHAEAIARDGLQIDGIRVREQIPIAVTTTVEEGLRGAELVLFCVKTVSTETAAAEMAPFLSSDAAILSMQNGVDNVDRILAATGIHAIPAAVYVAAEMTAPGRVTHTGRGDLIIGHRRSFPRAIPLEPIIALFERAEVPCRISDAIETELWTKMTMNCAYNAISVSETVAVARAEGVPLSDAAMQEAAYRLAGTMSGAISSTAQDIARGRPTEIDSLNGYVVRRGAELGIATPVSETLVTLVKLLEDSSVSRRAD